MTFIALVLTQSIRLTAFVSVTAYVINVKTYIYVPVAGSSRQSDS
jgi:hypothetical protein